MTECYWFDCWQMTSWMEMRGLHEFFS